MKNILVPLAIVLLLNHLDAFRLDTCESPCVGAALICPAGANCVDSCCVVPTTTPGPTPVGPTGCADLAPNCADLAYLCDDPDHKEIMRTNCAKTCHACDLPDPTCHDDPTAKCITIFNLCVDPRYKDIMTKECPVTCDLCGSPPGTCQDKDKNCDEWVRNGFCKKYDPSITKDLCPKSCNQC